MSAKDAGTGAEQRITISESSNLDSSEVERMIADAEQHRGEDSRLREMINARNELDAAAYQVERRLAELGAAVATHEKARAEMLVADARQAMKEDAPLERLRSLTSELQQAFHSLGVSSAAAPGPDAPPGGAGSGDGAGGGDDDVIDAEFTTE